MKGETMRKPVGHGEGLTGKHNCRCDLCRPLKNARARELSDSKPRVQRDWQTEAKSLLEGGASYHEVARTVGIDRRHVQRTLPGYGWTRGEGMEFKRWLSVNGVDQDLRNY